MDDTRFKSSPGERSLGRQVVVSGSFHDDDGVLNVVLLLGFANLLHGHLEEGGLMLQRLGFDQQIAKVVGHHPLRPMLGRIDADDGELFTTHLLDPRCDDAGWLL